MLTFCLFRNNNCHPKSPASELTKEYTNFQKRVSRGKRHYFWTGISDSQFTLVVSIPENYGRHRITPPPTDDIHRLSLTSKNISARQYLSNNWTVHPDW